MCRCRWLGRKNRIIFYRYEYQSYVVLGINMEGCKDILGIWIGEHESAKFWLNVLNDLKNRGVQSVYGFCVDGLTGFREAISSVYPKAQIQRCIIHQIRSSTKFVSYKDIKSNRQIRGYIDTREIMKVAEHNGKFCNIPKHGRK